MVMYLVVVSSIPFYLRRTSSSHHCAAYSRCVHIRGRRVLRMRGRMVGHFAPLLEDGHSLLQVHGSQQLGNGHLAVAHCLFIARRHRQYIEWHAAFGGVYVLRDAHKQLSVVHVLHEIATVRGWQNRWKLHHKVKLDALLGIAAAVRVAHIVVVMRVVVEMRCRALFELQCATQNVLFSAQNVE